MTKDVIKLYYTFNTKLCPDELKFGEFNYQPIPSDYCKLLNNVDGDGNNVPGRPVDYFLPEN